MIIAQTTAPGLEYGALGLVALVVLYVTYRLVNWMTTTLNGKLDRLTAATDANTAVTRSSTDTTTAAINENAGAIRDLTRKCEQLTVELERDRRAHGGR